MTITFVADTPLSAAQVNSELSFPTGAMFPYAGATAPPMGATPNAWLLCDGTAYSRTTYAALFAVVSTTYGVGDGATTFNVPDTRGRMVVGKGTHADVDALGDNDGTALANRGPKHQHTIYDPTHLHTITMDYQFEGAGADDFKLSDGSTVKKQGTTGSSNAASTGIKVNPAGAASSVTPGDTPAYIVTNYIIKT